MEICMWIDEETIESYAIGRLHKGSIRAHLDRCSSCVFRVAESRAWVETLRRGLRDLQEAGELPWQPNDDDSNRQDVS
jgi:hypothetical protein